MPFAEEFLEIAARDIESKSVAADFERARALIMQALERCAEAEQSINLKEVDIYIHGSYANKSNIYFPSNLEIIVEITTTKRFSPEEVSLEGNYFVDVPLPFGPREFRELFFEVLSDMVGDKLTEQSKALRLSGLEKIKHDIEITPCLSFHLYQDGGVRNRGILLYDSSVDRNIVSFPRLHAQNGFDKDQSTNGNFKRMVRLFKTLNSLNVNEFAFTEAGTASGYFIECLLYNVPNKLFMDYTVPLGTEHKTNAGKSSGGAVQGQSLREIFYKVINFLEHAELSSFVCQNTVWQLFGVAAEFWNVAKAEAFISSIIRLYSIFPASRTFLA